MRKSGIPTGHAGEYFVMGEVLRRGFDAQLADRNTKMYDLLVARSEGSAMHRVQVKTVRAAPWYVRLDDFKGECRDRTTVYVLLGTEDGARPVRYFIVKNSVVADHIHNPPNWPKNAFMPMKPLEQYENQWDNLFS